MNSNLIIVENLKKTYLTGGEAVHAIKGITLQISGGDSVAIMGQSGSGKSTLLTVIGGLSTPTDGKVWIDGIDVYGLNQEPRADFRLRHLGFVFQQFQLIPYLSALDNVLLPLINAKGTAKEKKARAAQALERVGITKEIGRLPGQLSGGEQERVAIARAIVNGPPVILADEPTGSLDSKTGIEIMELFRDLNREGQTIIMVTHNPANTVYMNRTIIMRDGLLSTDPADLAASLPQTGDGGGRI